MNNLKLDALNDFFSGFLVNIVCVPLSVQV